MTNMKSSEEYLPGNVLKPWIISILIYLFIYLSTSAAVALQMANTDLFLDKPEMKGSTPGISQSKFLPVFGHYKNHTFHFLLFLSFR